MVSSLYLHVPFCPQVCPYCDFHKMLRHDGLVARYLDRMEEQLAQEASNHPGALETIYFGGGTPSALTDPELERLFAAIEAGWGFPATRETTLEADPLTFDRERLRRWRDLGVSRLSMGVQSLQDDVLRQLGRLHNGHEARESIGWALDAGFEVSVDLMTAVDGQQAARDLHEVGGMGVPHVSVYTLTIEAGTPFDRRGVKVDQDRAADDYELAASILGQYGLERYEVSSHAKPGHESRHNQVYWHGRHYLGVGPSAASFLPSPGSQGVRITNPVMKPWLAGEVPVGESIDDLEYVLERLMTGLRTRAGVDTAQVREASGLDPLRAFERQVDEFVRHGLLEVSGSRLRATDDGLMKLDSVLRAFFAAADDMRTTAV